MSNYHDHLPILYDDIQDPVCVFEKSGDVHYCNEAFSTITGISVVRFLNRKVTVYNALKKLDGLDLNFSSVENFVQQSGIRICKYETKKNLRGLGQFSFKKFNYESSQQLYFLTFKDLTIEEDLVKSFRFETNILNKKISEMNQLIEIFQRIRLLDQPTQILNEYIDFFIKSSNISLACIYEENELKFVFKSDSYPEEKLASLTQDLDLYLSDKLISKYITDKLKCANNLEDYYYCSFVPFKFGQKLLLVVFIFEDLDLLKDFAHQSAIILNEQLYLMINNLNLKELSYTDGLTRLRNNMFFRNKLDEAFIQNKPVHLALFDVDYFKKINDVYGHPGGDAVLVFLGEIVPKTINQLKPEVTDITIARVGGEEFAILIVDSTLDFMKIFAEELRKKVETSKVRFNDLDINLTISIGIASSGQISNSSAEKPKTLYKLADDALYIAKRTGRNRISLSHDSN